MITFAHSYKQYISFMNAQFVYKSILENQKHYYSPDKKVDIESLLMNPFAHNERTVKGVLELSTFEIVQISDNIEIMLGITAEKVQKITNLFEIIEPQQLNLFPQIVESFYQILATSQNVYDIGYSLCGLTIKCIGKPDKHLIIQFRTFEMPFNELPKFIIFCMNDVTHLVKGDTIWVRLQLYQKEGVEVHTLESPLFCFEAGDIFSKREQDILTYLVKGCESKEIAQKLFISVFTVNNHRKNMMTRLGARDTTALIQLCLMAGIV